MVPGINGQERTREKLLISLREIMNEGLEFNKVIQAPAARQKTAQGNALGK